MGYDVGAPRRCTVNLDGTIFEGVSAVTTIPTVEELATAGTRNSDIYDLFVEHLESWSLTRDGAPLDPVKEEFDRLDIDLGKTLAFGWLEAVTTRAEPKTPLSARAQKFIEELAKVEETAATAQNGTGPPAVSIEPGL